MVQLHTDFKGASGKARQSTLEKRMLTISIFDSYRSNPRGETG
jgi:hypothetical protein